MQRVLAEPLTLADALARAQAQSPLVTAAQAQVAAARGIDPATYNWSSSRLYLNVAADLRVARGWTLFANLRNVTSVYEDVEIAGPATPAAAQLRSRADFGSLWSFGLRATR